MIKIVILISGRGSNMQSVVKANIANTQVVAVISNRADAEGLKWAAENGIATLALSHQNYASRQDFDLALMTAIDQYQPDLILLAGFMRVLGQEFCQYYNNKLINIHPSLLPAFQGLHTHQRVLESGCHITGCTVHFVTPELDCGPIIAQAVVPVYAADDAEVLAQRVLQAEHRLLPQVVADFAAGRLKVKGNRVSGCSVAHLEQKDSFYF